jgi:hypothetical protein
MKIRFEKIGKIRVYILTRKEISAHYKIDVDIKTGIVVGPECRIIWYMLMLLQSIDWQEPILVTEVEKTMDSAVAKLVRIIGSKIVFQITELDPGGLYFLIIGTHIGENK